ncbi:MAG TPA: hypothetical protein VK927_08820 [Adhaeribacter sp.]|nr:hypothetical protein [Adhaeribacter sp.]
MKKIFATTLFALTLFAAQAGGFENLYDKQASDIARRMANQIELNELEYIQVKKYTLEKIQEVAEIRDMYKTNPTMMADRIDETEQLYTSRIAYMLNAKQFDNYQALSKSFRSELNIIAENYSK